MSPAAVMLLGFFGVALSYGQIFIAAM